PRRPEISAPQGCRAFRAPHCRWPPPRRPCNPLLTLQTTSGPTGQRENRRKSASKRETAVTQRDVPGGTCMHPALYSWREELPHAAVRVFAYLGAAAVLSIVAAHIVQRGIDRPSQAPSARSQWVDVDKVFPAFALTIPEAAGVPAHYTIHRNLAGS